MKIGRFARYILASIDSYGKIIIAPGSEDEKLLTKKGKLDPDHVLLAPTSKIEEQHIVHNYSSGILIFYGAVKRAHRDNSDQRLGFYNKVNIPVMGVHRPYYVKEYFSTLSSSEASKAYIALEKEVRSYLSEMGAPQSIIDRMFNRASNQIDLIPDNEFRNYYKSEESFLEEWLIAKCGSAGYPNILQGNERADFKKMSREQIRSRLADKTPMSVQKLRKRYPSSSFSMAYIEQLYEKVGKYNRTVSSCRARAVLTHQKKWAKKHLGL